MGSPLAVPPRPKHPHNGPNNDRNDAKQNNETLPKPVIIHHSALTRLSVKIDLHVEQRVLLSAPHQLTSSDICRLHVHMEKDRQTRLKGAAAERRRREGDNNSRFIPATAAARPAFRSNRI